MLNRLAPIRHPKHGPSAARTVRAARAIARTSGERGSGTAIGVAIIFPMLMLVIAALHGISSSTRTDQSLQAVVDQAAHTASLCCLYVDDARDAAETSLEMATAEGPAGRLDCANYAADVTFFPVGSMDPADAIPDTATTTTTTPPPPTTAAVIRNQVPPGGTVEVFVICELPASEISAFALPGMDVRRSATGLASIDPYRNRHAGTPPTTTTTTTTPTTTTTTTTTP